MSSLLNKLRFKEGMRVCILNAPSGYEAEIRSLPAGVERAKALKGQFDLIHAFFTRKGQLEKEGPRLRSALRPNGILWLSYPKGRGLGTDLNRDILFRCVEPLGLTPVAQVAVDDVWSAMRCKATVG